MATNLISENFCKKIVSVPKKIWKNEAYKPVLQNSRKRVVRPVEQYRRPCRSGVSGCEQSKFAGLRLTFITDRIPARGDMGHVEPTILNF